MAGVGVEPRSGRLGRPMTDDTHEPDELDEYSLQELARRTGQNPRTLRSWATRGLLDGPTSMGRSARWPAADLLRIRAVQALRQDPSTSLDEIQAMFRSASLEDLQGWVDRVHPGATEDTSDVELESTETALEYVRALRDQLRTEPDGLPPVALDARGSPPRWSAHSDAHEPFTSSEARRHRPAGCLLASL